MISLKIQNLILIEKAEIIFGPGLNILTGETGSGKSAILSAIRLISGERAETQVIREGAEMAVVEAVIEGPIHVRREIYRNGKNRCFIDDAQVNLALLRKCVNIERVDQSSSLELVSAQQQRHMLDTFAGIVDEVKEHEASLAEERGKEAELNLLIQSREQRKKEIEWATKDLALIEEVNWQAGEEEKLSEEHHFLTHAQELAEKMSAIAFTFTEGTELPALKRALMSLEGCLRFDSTLSPHAASIKSALMELHEAGRALASYTDRLEADPNRLIEVEKRIAAIETLKRRFGPDIETQKKNLQEKVELNLDSQIEQLQTSLSTLRKKNDQEAEVIRQKRCAAKPPLTAQILTELKSLNIPHAQFAITEENRFLFSANPGLAPIPLEQCASGGELSRVLLALKTILGGESSCLVFDEIDSNVGGQTAAILGEKLRKLAAKRQVICVTHFVQVAKCATDHFLVAKKEKEGHAITTIQKMSEREREKEYARMTGSKT
ncbi:MAG TPA: AAA family ATPase [Chlamydiales bacterium]|nr:AAA family ATPase [Chlamydiales bacterium]